MIKYERLTERDENGIAVYKHKCDADSFEENMYIHAQREGAVVNRLAELEDKIENGTLIELPRIIHPNKAEWYVQYQYPSGIIQYFICFSEADAEQILKELKGEV